MTHLLAPAPLQDLRRYYEAVRPSPTHRYFRPRGGSRLHLFPWHRRQGSHVPYRSLIELRAAYTPDAAWSVSGHPPSLSRRKGHPAVWTSLNPAFDASEAVRLRSPLSILPAGIIAPTFPRR